MAEFQKLSATVKKRSFFFIWLTIMNTILSIRITANEDLHTRPARLKHGKSNKLVDSKSIFLGSNCLFNTRGNIYIKPIRVVKFTFFLRIQKFVGEIVQKNYAYEKKHKHLSTKMPLVINI